MNVDLNKTGKFTLSDLSPEELSKLHILKRVDVKSLWGIIRMCPVRELDKGEILLSIGQINRTMYILLEGQLSVHLSNPDNEPIAFLETGQTVGEVSVIESNSPCAYVIASKPSRLLAVDESAFWTIVETSHAFAANMLHLLTARLRDNNTKIEDGLNRRRVLENEVLVDALTGLRNRRWLDQNLQRITRRHQIASIPLSIIMLDVDHFKNFNDNFGHAAGDRVLKATAEVIASKLRPTDMSARYGGEEFCIILPGTPLQGGVVAANRLRETIEKTTVVCNNGKTLPTVTVSLGLACLSEDEDETSLLSRADSALYKAKSNGRNRVET